MAAHLLIVEDEEKLARFVELELVHEGYEVSKAFDGRTGLKMATENKYDLILLDIMLPGLNGLEVLRRLMQDNPTPVILLTARDAVMDKVSGLDAGACDYITKPFAIEELLARVAAVLRRANAVAKPRADMLALGGTTVDFATMMAHCDGVSSELTKSEALFLRLLASERGRCFSFDEIFAALRGEGYIGDDNAVRCIAKRLKAKIGSAGELISNTRGVGYKLVR